MPGFPHLSRKCFAASRVIGEPWPKPATARLRALAAFIKQNLSSPLRLDNLAAIAGLSKAHLARSFRNVTGISLHRYVLHHRLERARSLLSRADARVHTVAIQCGFADAPHLSKAYRKAYGITPASTPTKNRDNADPLPRSDRRKVSLLLALRVISRLAAFEQQRTRAESRFDANDPGCVKTWCFNKAPV
jgi:AraC-like DNA-binding protein